MEVNAMASKTLKYEFEQETEFNTIRFEEKGNKIDEFKVEALINSYIEYKQITFVIYVIKTMNTPYKSILYDDSGPIYSNNAIFPINLLRDLSIESIDTTHYFICDIDAFPSKSLYDSIVLHKELLYDHKAVFVLKLFKVITRSKKLANQCRKYGLCNKMYYIKTMN